jgi:histidinol-phosphate/aromatic aminotransferase/cobyric acid decarboxylase-like protein
MAGIRLGYAVAILRGSPKSTRCARPTTINTLTQAIVPVLLRHSHSHRAGRGDPPRARTRGQRAFGAAAGHRVPFARQLPAGPRSRCQSLVCDRCATRASSSRT